MSRKIYFLTLVVALVLMPAYIQEAIPDGCVEDYKKIYPTLFEMTIVANLEAEELIALVNVQNTTEISIRNIKHGFLLRKVNIPSGVKAIFNLVNNKNEMVVIDSKQNLHLVNYYYGVLWSSYVHPEATEIVSVSDFEDGNELKKSILVAYKYDAGKKYGLDVVDLESNTIVNSLKDLPAFTSILALKESKIENAALRVSSNSIEMINFMNGELIRNVASSVISDYIEVVDKDNSTEVVYAAKNVITAFNCSDFNSRSLVLEKEVKSLVQYGKSKTMILAFQEDKIALVDWFEKKVVRNYENSGLKLTSLRAISQEGSNEIIVPVKEDVVKINVQCFEDNREKEYDEFGVQLALGVGLGVPFLSFAILAAFIIYNRRLDAKENYIDPNDMQTDTKV